MFDKILFIVMYCMELHNDVTKKDMLSKVRYRLQKKVFSRSTRDDTYACCRWIYFTFSKSNNVIKQLLIDEDVPFVVIGKPLDEKDQFIIHIDNDNEKAGHDLCSYLYHKGHRHIIFINESGQYAVTDDRSTGFRDEARQRGITHEILETENNRDSIQTLLQTYFMNEELSVRPTAIISSDGVIHHTVLSVLYNLNIQIPADVCTATFNDSLLTEMGSPPQTTVNIHPVELGNKSERKLYNY